MQWELRRQFESHGGRFETSTVVQGENSVRLASLGNRTAKIGDPGLGTAIDHIAGCFPQQPHQPTIESPTIPICQGRSSFSKIPGSPSVSDKPGQRFVTLVKGWEKQR